MFHFKQNSRHFGWTVCLPFCMNYFILPVIQILIAWGFTSKKTSKENSRKILRTYSGWWGSWVGLIKMECPILISTSPFLISLHRSWAELRIIVSFLNMCTDFTGKRIIATLGNTNLWWEWGWLLLIREIFIIFSSFGFKWRDEM